MRTLAIFITGALAILSEMGAEWRWKKLPSLPNREGFAGAYAGVSGDMLLVAGGANFPDKKPWEGGKKVWYDTVFGLDQPEGQWTVAGKLPRPLGYGVSVTYHDGVVCVGGSDADRHYSDAFRLELRSGKLVTTALPPLPMTVANACGALVGDTLYIAGGQEKPDSKETLKKVFTLNLGAKELRWRAIGAWPGPGRMLAVAAAFNGAFWLMGGTDLVIGEGGKSERRYLKDAYRYDPGKGWKRIADLPHAVVAAPSPAPATAAGPVILGGDDGTQVGVTPERHHGFSKRVLCYDQTTGRWTEDGELPAPRVTAPLVSWKGSWVIPSGEARPGVRSPEVWSVHAR